MLMEILQLLKILTENFRVVKKCDFILQGQIHKILNIYIDHLLN